ncbi:MAG: glycosyltransferase [Bacteroidales bacterium]|nr:glycosyltransferase [Bacteroidales bacterium]
MKVSLIIPVYNAEKTLPATLESIRNQTFRDFETIFVEDCGTDGSLSLLEAFCQEHPGCKLIRQEHNSGAAAARNRALEAAEGEYLAFADADDLMVPVMLEHAVAAVPTPAGPADIVGWDWTLGLTHDGRYMRQADYATPFEALQVLMGGAARWNLWLFLVRRDLVERHGIRFVPGADLGEDMQFMLRAFLFAERVVQLHESLYRYNAVSSTSISRGFTLAKRAQIEKNLTEFAHDFAHTPFGKEHPMMIAELKLYLKRPLLISPDRSDYETWYAWFPEVNAHATEGASLPTHTRILQRMAARRNWVGVKLYYLLVHKLVYGILYR